MSESNWGNWPWRRSVAWLALLAPLFYLTYGLANWWAGQQMLVGEVPSVVFAWEQHIPFWSWTIFPYWSINVFYGLSLFLSTSRHRIDRHAVRLLTAQIIAVTCFVLWPLHFSFGQPEAHGAAGFLFDALRSFDQPFNQAPSLHIALAVILWDWFRQFARRLWSRVLLHVWTLLICVSVLTTYQHHFIDIPTGVLLGVICVWLWPLESQASLLKNVSVTRDAQRLKLALFYAVPALFVFVLALGLGGVGLWLMWSAVALGLVALNYLSFGARGFRMDEAGQMHWSARWLFAPYRFGAAINAKLWTRTLPDKVDVMPDVWLGRRPDQRRWLEVGQPKLVSLCAELTLHPTMRQSASCVPMLDLVVPSATCLKRAADAIEAQRLAAVSDGNEGAVWVCCALGFSRSAAAVIAWLLIHRGVRDLSQAEALVRQARPQIVLGASWQSALAELVS